jgi:hypothetical protein
MVEEGLHTFSLRGRGTRRGGGGGRRKMILKDGCHFLPDYCPRVQRFGQHVKSKADITRQVLLPADFPM